MPHPRDKNGRPPTPPGTLAVWLTPPARPASMERPTALGAAPTVQGRTVPLAQGPAAGGNGGTILGVGAVIGQRYVIEQHVSSGGFGAVYRASDREIGHHQVALKLLHRPSASQDEREAALRELKLIAAVSHPSVVQFKEYGWHEGRLWFAMPWYHGQTLDRMIGTGHGAVAMGRAEARPLFTRIAQGLAAMHAVGIHHHDIKPENIFVAEIAGFPGGLPVLLDLGIATQRGENPTGLTVEYASPETAAAMLGSASRPVGAAADVYSLALVLRNAVDPSTASPVRTEEVLPLLHQRATEPVVLSKRRELKYLRPSFERWLSLNPEARPSAAELADELAVLTAPEERKEARIRLLRRILPIVLLAGVLIAGLVVQLRQKETALTVQGRALEQEKQAGEQLRKQSEMQLDQLELHAQTLGDKRQELQQALGLARRLHGQVASAAKRASALEARVSKLGAERDQLATDKAVLTDERDGLTRDNEALSAQRASLTAKRDELEADNARLNREDEDNAQVIERLGEELDQALAARADLESRGAALAKERDRLAADQEAHNAKYEAATRQRDEAIARQRELEQQLSRLKAGTTDPETVPSASDAPPADAVRAPIKAVTRRKQRIPVIPAP